MLNREWIRKAEHFLKESFDAAHWLDAKPEAKAYRIEHSYRVANIGRQIAEGEGFDQSEMALACLLHDIAYCEDLEQIGWKEHGRRSARMVRPFLRELGLAEDRVQDICYGIAIHVDDEADFPGERTPFALSVGDADNIDRFDVLRVHEALCRDGFLELRLEEKRDYVAARLAGLRKLRILPTGTATAGELWRSRLSFGISFYEKLAAQLENSRTIPFGDQGAVYGP